MAVIECKVNLWGKDGLQDQKILAQGNALGNHNQQVVGAPCMGKKSHHIYKAFAPSGRVFPFTL